jgi:hypothetical protein
MKPKYTKAHCLTWTGKPGIAGHISNSSIDTVSRKIYYEVHFSDGETACAEESELSIMHDHYEPDGSDTQYSIEQDYGLEQGQDWFPAFQKQQYIEQQAEAFNYEFGKKGYAALEIVGGNSQWREETFTTIDEVYSFLLAQGLEWNGDWWVQQDEVELDPTEILFVQGSRVASDASPVLGVVLEIQGRDYRVGWDDNIYTNAPLDALKPAKPSPAFRDLPERQQEFLLALYNKKPVVKNAATRMALRNWGYITLEDTWEKIKLTPYGRYETHQHVQAVEVGDIEPDIIDLNHCKHYFASPDDDGNVVCQRCGLNARVRKTEAATELPDLEPDVDDSIAATEPSYVGDGFTEEYAEDRDEFGDHYPLEEEAAELRDLAQQMAEEGSGETINLAEYTPDLIERHRTHKLVIPEQDRPGENLFFEQEVAKQLEDLKAALAEANKREQELEARLVEEQRRILNRNATIERQQKELEALKDTKVNAAISAKPTARAYVTKTLVQNVDPNTYGELMSALHLADDELMQHVSAGWRVVHEAINSVYRPEAEGIAHFRIVRLEQRPTPERTRRAEAKAEATPENEQIIFEAGEIVEKAFTFEEALKSGKFSANELAEIGNAEVMATMKRTFEAQTSSSKPLTPLPLFGNPSASVSQIIMEVSQDE